MNSAETEVKICPLIELEQLEFVTMKLPHFIKKRIDTRKIKRLTLEDKRKLVTVIEHRQKEEEEEKKEEAAPQQEPTKSEQPEPEANKMETKTSIQLEGKEEENAAPQQKRNVPLIETHISKSKDGKYIIHKTVITDIKPVAYYEKVLQGSE